MKKIFLSLLCLLTLITFTGCGKKEETSLPTEEKEPEVVKKLQIINEDSDSRVIAVQINNHNQARIHHAGLQDAFLIYEMIVEGGITRMTAYFKDQTTTKIGSVRSARPYFLDYALENDAIYVHYGFSEQARQDIATLGVDNINGLYDDAFWRDTTLKVNWEHKAFTSMEKINDMVAKKGYRTTSTQKTVLNYSVDEIDLAEKETTTLEDGTETTTITNPANSVTIPYSTYMTVRYDYDADKKVYNRFANGVAHTDAITKEQYHFKNIIIAKIKNYAIDSYGRQALDNIGTGSGYYITDGCVKEITWSKSSRSAQTVYKYLDGSEIKVNDGNTFIQIVPINSEITFK